MTRYILDRLWILARALLLSHLLFSATFPPIEQAHAAAAPGVFTNTNGPALDNYMNCLRYAASATGGVCDIYAYWDSIGICTEITPCTYGPYNTQNSPSAAYLNELIKHYPLYSTGFRIPFKLMPTATVDGGIGGYTLTSGTVSSSTALFGQGQTGYSLNGQQNLTCTAVCVLTINVGQGWRQINIICGKSTTTTGWTVAINAVTQSPTACGTTAASAQGEFDSYSNAAITTGTASSWSISGTTLTVTTVASGTFAAGGVLSGTSVTSGTTILEQMTGATQGGAGTYALSASSTASSGTLTQTGGLVNLSVTLTSTGTSSFLNGYEAITAVGNNGIAFHALGEGAESSAFNTQNATALGVMNLIEAQPGRRAGLCSGEGGQNDAQNPGVVTPAQVVANWQTVAVACAALGASFSFSNPTPYNSSTANQYAFIQNALWQWAMRQQGGVTGPVWDFLDWGTAWAGAGVTGVSLSGGPPNYIARNLAAAIAQDVSLGLLQPADSQHPTDYGSCLISWTLIEHFIPGSSSEKFNCYWEAQQVANSYVTLTQGNYTNATTSFTSLADTLNTVQWTVYGYQIVHIRCHLYTSVAAAAALSATISGTGTPLWMNQSLEAFTGATAKAEITSQTATFSTAVTLGTAQTATTVFTEDYAADLQYAATANATTTIAVQLHPSTSTQTIYKGSGCQFFSP